MLNAPRTGARFSGLAIMLEYYVLAINLLTAYIAMQAFIE
jgi:hypothetical protein